MKCFDSSHQKSENTGRCLDCAREKQARYRAQVLGQIAGRLGAPPRAEIIQGLPCKRCGSTERYAKTGCCRPCQKARTDARRLLATESSELTTLLTSFLTLPRITDGNTSPP